MSDVNLESKDDIYGSEECAVISPVKKKQKSNDYTSTSNVAAKHINKNHKILLPPKVTTISQQAQHPINKKYVHVAHGLSVGELLRIEALKKNDLISEIKAMDGEYHKSWTKPVLVETLLRTYATFHQPETQFHSSAVASPGKSELGGDDVDMESTTALDNWAHSPSVDMARTKSADNNIKMKCQSDAMVITGIQQKHNNNDSNEVIYVADDDDGCNIDDRMSVSSIPALSSDKVETTVPIVKNLRTVNQNNGENNNAINEDMEKLIKQVPSNDSDEAAYGTARENFSQSPSEQVEQQGSSNSSNLILTKHNNGSNFEAKALLVVDKKQPQKTRVSPNTVPPGIVNSAKKSLLLSSQKKKETYLFSNMHQPPPVGRLLYNDTRWTASNADSGQAGQQVEQQNTTSFYDVESMSSNATSSTNFKNQWTTNRILSTPAYNSNGATLVISQKVQASKEARHAQVARMKEKVSALSLL